MRQAHLETAPAWLIWGALVVVYIVWGSTYLAIRVVVETMPPLLSGSARFVVAALLMYAFVIVRSGPRAIRISRAELIGSTGVGLALLSGGNGLVMLGERDVPSGLAALIIAVVPLWVVLLRMLFGEHVKRGTLIGVLTGFAGVAVLVLPRGLSGDVALVGMLMLVVAGASWAVGSYYSRRLALPADPLVSTATQMLMGGTGLAVVGLVSGELGLLQLELFSTESVISLVDLVIFGSIVGYTAYTWLLQNTNISKVSTYAYVNPVVALILGWVILSEAITLSILVGGAMIVLAVGLVIRTESRPREDAGALEAPPAQAALPDEAIEPAAR
jgi:drug/metabolite transporter (DMT)-like permease